MTGANLLSNIVLAAASVAHVAAGASSMSIHSDMPQVLHLKLNLTKALHTAAPNFLGVNIDTASLYQGTIPHRLEFDDAGLVALSKSFAAAGGPGTTLRVGGSTAEDTIFGAVPFGGNHVAIDPAYWDALVEFASTAGFELVYDLNAMGFGNSMRLPPDNRWNVTNAASLLARVAAHPGQRVTLKAVQLGNEPGHYAAETIGAPTATEHGR
eukprot:SAG11_NODE_4737_length_1786_cov_1.477178_1_plen_210_part_01